MSKAKKRVPTRASRITKAKVAADFNRVGASVKLGMGPLSFDSNMARRHGWTNAEIARYWESAAAAYKQISRKVYKRHPELYDLRHPKDPIYIGPDESGNTLRVGPAVKEALRD